METKITLLLENFAAWKFRYFSRSSSENREIKMMRKMNFELNREIKMHENNPIFLIVKLKIQAFE